MSENYKPGTVAMVSYREGNELRGIRVPGGWSLATAQSAFIRDASVTSVRPLVTLDPEVFGAGGVEYVVRLLRHVINESDMGGYTLRQLADALDEQAGPKPPEPRGLGAVVEDSEGKRWTNTGMHMPNRWACATEYGWVDYPELDVVKVLSEGVEA